MFLFQSQWCLQHTNTLVKKPSSIYPNPLHFHTHSHRKKRRFRSAERPNAQCHQYSTASACRRKYFVFGFSSGSPCPTVSGSVTPKNYQHIYLTDRSDQKDTSFSMGSSPLHKDNGTVSACEEPTGQAAGRQAAPCAPLRFSNPHGDYYRNFYPNFKHLLPFSPQRKRAVYLWYKWYTHRQELSLPLTAALAVSAELAAFFRADCMRNTQSPSRLPGWAVPVR